MEKLTSNQQIISNDILRYKKNKLAGSLVLLGLVFNCLYFMLLYAMPKEEFRTITIGFSVVLTLVVLLAVFLSSEGVKGYNKKFSIVLIVIAVFQIVRIFGYPLKGIRENLFVAQDGTHTIGYFGFYPETSTPFFVILLIFLIASAVCFVASAVIGWIYAVRLEKFQKDLDNGLVSVDEALKDEERQDEAKARATANLINPNPVIDNQFAVDNNEIGSVEAEIIPESIVQEVE